MKRKPPNFAVAMIVDDAIILIRREGRFEAAKFMMKYRVPFSVAVRVLEPQGRRRWRPRLVHEEPPPVRASKLTQFMNLLPHAESQAPGKRRF